MVDVGGNSRQTATIILSKNLELKRGVGLSMYSFIRATIILSKNLELKQEINDEQAKAIAQQSFYRRI